MRNVSTSYLTIDSTTMVNAIKETLTARGIDHTIRYSRGAGTKEVYDIRLHLHTQYALGNDSVTPRIIIKNSYQGESACIVTGGFIRWVCNNGMVFGSDWFASRIVHRVGNTAESKLKQLQYDLVAVADYIAEELPSQIDELVNTELTEGQMLDIVGNLNLAKSRKEWVMGRIVNQEARRYADQANNLWTLWNLCNEAIGRNYRSEVRNFERNVSLIDDILFLYDQQYSQLAREVA